MKRSHTSPDHQAVSVFLADRSPMECELLVGVLQRHTRLAIQAAPLASGDLVKTLRQKKPNVAVVSADLPDGHHKGLTVLQCLVGSGSAIRCILLVDFPERDLIVEAFRNGARGIFYRLQSPAALRKCILCVHKGQIWAGTTEMDFILSALTDLPPLRIVDSRGMALLTNREEDIVRLLLNGMTNREIASRLRLSEHTVKNYCMHIFDKMGVSNRLEAVLHALMHREVVRSRPELTTCHRPTPTPSH